MYIKQINIAPRQASACPIELEDLAAFLRNLFASSSSLVANDFDKAQIQRLHVAFGTLFRHEGVFAQRV